jgi:hypothetical protein
VDELYHGWEWIFPGFDPPFFVALLGLLERIVPGSALFTTLDASLFFGSLIALTRLRAQASWLAPLAALAIVLSPLTMIMEGTVWKDVLFANLAVAGFVALAFAARPSSSVLAHRAAQALALLALAFAALTRQNGLVALLGGAVASALIAGRYGRRMLFVRGATAFALGLVIVAVVTGLLSLGQTESVEQASLGAGIREVEQYDIVGATHYDPNVDLSALGDPGMAQAVRDDAASAYSPVREETMTIIRRFRALPADAVRAEWISIVRHDPRAYLQHRFATFGWLVFAPRLALCVPVHVGIEGRPRYLKALHLTQKIRPQDRALYNYSTYFFFTPVYSQSAYALGALACLALLALRRRPEDIAIAFMLLSGLAFAATFFFISLACDFRYLFFMDAATMTAVLYLACDPPWAELRALRRPLSAAAAR